MTNHEAARYDVNRAWIILDEAGALWREDAPDAIEKAVTVVDACSKLANG